MRHTSGSVTVELAQLVALNQHLRHRGDLPALTAADLWLDGARLLSGPHHGLSGAGGPVRRSGPGLPAGAVLARLCWEGPPEYPYIHAHFGSRGSSSSGSLPGSGFGAGTTAPAGGDPGLRVDVHTRTLGELSRRLGLRHRWGF